MQVCDDATARAVCALTLSRVGVLALWNKSEPLNRVGGERCGDAAGWKYSPSLGAIVGAAAYPSGLRH